jgi:hypothetical protein
MIIVHQRKCDDLLKVSIVRSRGKEIKKDKFSKGDWRTYSSNLKSQSSRGEWEL